MLAEKLILILGNNFIYNINKDVLFMKRICSRIVMILSLAVAVFLMNSSTSYASWLQVTSGNIGLGYSALSDTITFTEYDKTIKIKIGNHFLDSENNLYIYMNDHKIASIAVGTNLSTEPLFALQGSSLPFAKKICTGNTK